MKFEVVVEEFGDKLHPYSNKPQLDVDCILQRIASFKSTGPARHVVFIGESHESDYDKMRRALVIETIKDQGRQLFPDGVPKIIAERFKDVESSEVDSKEPDLPDKIPSAIRALRKPDARSEDSATGVISPNEAQARMASSGNWVRNQWFVAEIMSTIERMGPDAVPIVIVCGDDHAKYVSGALADLAVQGYASDAVVVWHHFVPSPDAVKPMNEVRGGFNFSLNGKKAAGFIAGQEKQRNLVQLEQGILKERFMITLVASYGIEGPGWALYMADEEAAQELRQTLENDTGRMSYNCTASDPIRVVKITGKEDLENM